MGDPGMVTPYTLRPGRSFANGVDELIVPFVAFLRVSVLVGHTVFSFELVCSVDPLRFIGGHCRMARLWVDCAH